MSKTRDNQDNRLRNPLINYSVPIFGILMRLRLPNSVHISEASFRKEVTELINNFEKMAQQYGINNDVTLVGRYAICTAVDEAVLSTPWGVNSSWPHQTLLSQYHNDTWGGEKFFLVLNKLAENPTQNILLLELFNALLALGFRGKFATLKNGDIQLDTLRQKLAKIIDIERGTPAHWLSDHWHGSPTPKTAQYFFLPLWITILSATITLLACYSGYVFSLYDRFEITAFQLNKFILRSTPIARVQTHANTPPQLTLAILLKNELQQKQLILRDQPGQSTIIIKGDSLFSSGSTHPSQNMQSLLQQIGNALSKLPGSVLITGHTDNKPVRSLSLRSNMEISSERARNVAQLLGQYVSPSRIRTIGRGELEPLVANKDDASRAENRRVEISLVTLN